MTHYISLSLAFSSGAVRESLVTKLWPSFISERGSVS